MTRVLTILAAVVALGVTAAPASALEPPTTGPVPIPYPNTGLAQTNPPTTQQTAGRPNVTNVIRQRHDSSRLAVMNVRA
jgi:hypothetical protein